MMNPFRKIVLFISFLLTFNCLKAQTEFCTIKGHVTDTSGEALSLVSVMLLNPSDSTLLEYVQADEKGYFTFQNVERKKYLLKTNYISYFPLQIPIHPTSKILDLGKLQMTTISKELFEVVIKAAKAPMTIKGDTIEYDATTFKVPPGSTVEDLLRKLPGMEVDQQGAITADGKNVNRVMVDGKNFFGGDPKAATKNLPAEGIAKVQVFNELTEEQKITGQKRLNSDKAMNLELKEDFKKGGFGKIIAGIGTENTKELKGNYNKFNSTHQFSLIGSGTNTGRNGLSWNDYQDFKGSNSFNWGDDGDFGFGNGSNYRFTVFDDGDEDDNNGIGSFFGGDNFGFPEKVSAGINYNFDNSKSKLSGMYFYEINNLQSDAYRTQNFLYPINSYNTLDTADRDNRKMSNRVELRLEQEIDSFSSIIIKSNQSLGQRKTLTNSISHSFTPYEILLNDQISSTDQNGSNLNSQNSLIYKKKFRKKGRSFGFSGAYNIGNSERESENKADNTFYQIRTNIDSVGNLNQNYNTDQLVKTYKANALWMEPIGKKMFSRTFYNFNHGITDYERIVSDNIMDQKQLNELLSRDFNNKNNYNRLGQSFSYNNEGLNVSLGSAYQEIYLNSNFSSKVDSMPIIIQRVYQNLIPNFEIEYETNSGSEVSLQFNRNVNAPNSKDLLPIVDNSNPLFVRIGNPDLQPRSSNEMSISFRKFNRLKFTNLFSRIGYRLNDKDIIYSESIGLGNVKTTQPININGTRTLYANINYNFPIIKNKFTFNLGYNYNYNLDKAITNGIVTQPVSNVNGFRVGSNITPTEAFTLFINANYRINEQRAGVDSAVASKVDNYGGSADLNFKLPKLFYFNSNFNINSYSNTTNDFQSTIPILNLSIYKLFLKDNKAEARLSVYDVFNKTIGIQQFIRSNQISQSETLSLARYVILSFTYNMRGIKSNLEKGNRRMMY